MTKAMLLEPGWRESMIAVNDVELHVVEAGEDGAPLLILLHGFPEFWWAWRKQISWFAEAGYHVVAPDMRGYNRSAKPRDLRAYSFEVLVADVIGCADAFGADRFFVVGHDWGAAIAWGVAARAADRLRRFAAINGPQLGVWRHQARRHPKQALRSSYVAVFQLPWLPEAVLSAFDFAALKSTMRASAEPDTFGPATLDRYARAWRKRGSLTAMLNYYRALRLGAPSASASRIKPPVLVLWGTRDRFLERHVMECALEFCDDGRFVAIEGATHWMHLERPGQINAAIAGFLGDPGGAADRSAQAATLRAESS